MSSPFALRCAVKLLPMMQTSALTHSIIEDVIDAEINRLTASDHPAADFIRWLTQRKAAANE